MRQKPLHIVFDLRPLQAGSAGRGVGVYVRNLLYHLSKIDRQNRYTLFHYHNLPVPDFRVEDGFNYSLAPVQGMPGGLGRLKIFNDYLFLSGRLKRLEPDVVHFTNPLELDQHYRPGSLSDRSVCTFYDLTPLYFRDLIFKGRRKLLWPVFRWLLSGIRKMARVIAISQKTAEDLCRETGIPKDSVEAIPLALPVNTLDTPGDGGKPLPDDYGDFAFYVGALSPQKNVDFLAPVVEGTREKTGVNLNLVIAGNVHTEDRQRFVKIAKDCGLAGHLHFTGYISRRKMEELYRQCRCVLFPSLYEGFCFPALEAMAQGAPLICSRAASLPEVVGDGGILLDPGDRDRWILETSRVITDEKLARELSVKGKRQAAKFSWEKNAVKTLEVYRKVAAQAGRRASR